ncbi:hypothetical protein H4R24_003651 [Coemansia sp. RSA 988]|nr:hypothetical protein H4R24_003651 [Coemansia sp. RSA 988]
MDIGGTSHLLNTFAEFAARITSHALTDKEKESVVQGFRRFHERLERFNTNSSLKRLAIDSQNIRKPSLKCQHEDTSCWQNSIRGFIKAYIVGFSVKYGLNIVPHLLSLRAFKRPSLLLRGFCSDTYSFAAFLSVLIGSYKAFLCTLRRLRGEEGNDHINALIAGMLAGIVSAKLDRSPTRRKAISLYLFSRALQYGSVWLFDGYVARQEDEEVKARSRWMTRAHSDNVTMYSKHGQEVPESHDNASNAQPVPTMNWSPEKMGGSMEPSSEQSDPSTLMDKATDVIRRWAPTALMTVAVTALTFEFVFHTDTLPQGFVSFFSKNGGYDSLYPRKMNSGFKLIGQDFAHNTNSGRRIPAGVPTKDYLSQMPLGKDVVGAFDSHIHHDFVACGIYHPHTTSCLLGLVSTVLRSFPNSMKMYVPFNAMVYGIFKNKELRKDPLGTIVKLIKSSARSSLFFALMVASTTNGSCILRALLGRDTFAGYLVAGVLGGLAVLVEAPSRRIELAMYVFLRALGSGWNISLKQGLCRSMRHGEVALFSFSMAILMAIYQNKTTTFSLAYRSTLTRIFGKN